MVEEDGISFYLVGVSGIDPGRVRVHPGDFIVYRMRSIGREAGVIQEIPQNT
jgi:hypothetical protein